MYPINNDFNQMRRRGRGVDLATLDPLPTSLLSMPRILRPQNDDIDLALIRAVSMTHSCHVDAHGPSDQFST